MKIGFLDSKKQINNIRIINGLKIISNKVEKKIS